MPQVTTQLKALLVERHWQSYPAFSREYRRAAKKIDDTLASTAPSREQFQRWTAGRVKTKPQPNHCVVLERMFPGHSVVELFAEYVPPQAPRSTDEETTTNRRQLLQVGGATLAGVLLQQMWSEPSKMQAALDECSVGDPQFLELRQSAKDLGTRAIQVPTASLAEETLYGFHDVRKLLEKKQSLKVKRELAICGAMYATVMGEILFNENHFTLAKKWYGIAMKAAGDAKHQFLVDIAHAGGTYLPTYTPDPHGVLASVDPRLETPHRPTPAITWLWAFKAKAHAMLGDEYAFRRSIDKARQCLDLSSPDQISAGIFSFLPEKLEFYEARGWVELQNAEAASAAADRALALYDFTETTEPALVRFEQASAYAQIGELQEACRIGISALMDQRTYHSVTVVTRAGEFNRLLGPSRSEAVRNWREILSTVRKPTPLALVSA